MSAILDVKDLTVAFHTRHGVVRAVDGVSLKVEAGQTVGIVGESGSGKSVTCYSLLGLIPQPPGRIEGGSAMFGGQDLLELSETELQKVRGSRISMIFQDPMTSLNPYLKIGTQLVEPLCLHRGLDKTAAWRKGIEALEEVGIPDPVSRMDQYPHEFSGGMRQRVMIAMALITRPELLIADEPTTALDVTIQQQVLDLIKDLQKRLGIAVIFITHDLAVVHEVCDVVNVMYAGRLCGGSVRPPAPRLHARPDALHPRPAKERRAPLHHPGPAAGSQSSPLRLRLPGPADARPAGALSNGSATSAAGNRAWALGPGLSRLCGRRATAMSDFLVIDNASISFPGRGRAPANLAVDGVSLTLAKGEILGLVGESGCGKSTLSRAIMQLQPLTSGRIVLEGQDLSLLNGLQLRAARLNFQMVFQDPYASLNPRLTVFSTLAEAIQARTGKLSGSACWAAVEKLLERVGLDPTAALKYPHEFSGGQRQRIAIARALGPEPRLLIADEPVSALDVSIQSQIINLLLKLSRELQLTMLFVSHDLSVVRYLADRVAVMHRGRIVELGETESLMATPQHEYSKTLLAAAPALRMRRAAGS